MSKRLLIKNKTEKIAVCAMCIAMLFVTSFFESVLNFENFAPGVKLGLSNIVIIISMYNFGFFVSLAIVFLKILINSLILSGFSSFIFTAVGSLASFLSMWGLKNLLNKNASCVGISVAGGFFHILGQYTAFFLVMNTKNVFLLFPLSASLSVLCAFLVGIICNIILKLMNFDTKIQ